MHIIPDLKRLEQKYGDALFVIGVHSAKFSSEKDSDNIRGAIMRYDLEHPVINDRDMRVWNEYGIESWPTLVLIDPEGKVYGFKAGEGIYDLFDKAIGDLVRRFDAAGKLNRTHIALKLEKDKRPATTLAYPGKIAADAKGGRLFIADSNHNRIVVASVGGAIQTTIGAGAAGLKDGDFATAQFDRPQGLAYDPARDALYVADTDNHAIRKVDLAAKQVTTLAGTGHQARQYPPEPGVGRNVSLSTPWDVLQIGDTLYIAMAGCHQLWTLDLKTLRAQPFAGTGMEDRVDGRLSEANLAQPSGLSTDGRQLFVADSEVSAIREADLAPTGSIRTIIGQGLFDFGDVDGKYPDARLQHPLGVAYHDGFVFVADTYNHKLKRVNPRTRTVETIAGTGKRGLTDGAATTAQFSEPSGLAWVGDKLYVADTDNSAIRIYDPAAQTVSTLKLTGAKGQ